jgi:hypothetical protein
MAGATVDEPADEKATAAVTPGKLQKRKVLGGHGNNDTTRTESERYPF